MSKFMSTHENRTGLRWQLLATVSAIALIGPAYGTALAADSDRPQVWIELGGQLSRLDDGQETFAPPLMANRPSMFAPSQKFERPPLYGFDEYGRLSFQPEDSDWLFSASIRYGRSSASRHVRQQTYPEPFHFSFSGIPYQKTAKAAHFADTNARTSERNFILDFQAGKDVGLGMFGAKDGSAVLGFGVRFAQFNSRSNIALKSDPDWHFFTKYFNHRHLPFGENYHTNLASMSAERSFHGVGPSISWNASAPFAGNPQDSELTFDWGVNAALLFGRQRTKVHHQTTALYHKWKYDYASRRTVYHPTPVNAHRTKSISVPNVGGFAGISYCYAGAKISIGYRGDFFFNAMDGGIDARKSEVRGFYGPFASISVGLGD